MKNKLFSLFLILVLALSLCACGGKDTAPRPESGEASAAAESTAAPAPEVSAPEQPAIPALPDAGLHEQEETPEPYAEAEIAQRLELAKSFLEKDVQDLIDALGEPLERSYAPAAWARERTENCGTRAFPFIRSGRVSGRPSSTWHERV